MFLPCPAVLFVVFLNFYSVTVAQGILWNAERKLEYREATRDLWNHGYNSYIQYAFPMDELKPLSCSGHGPDWDEPSNIGTNDVAGNYSLTLIDVLDTLAIMGDQKGFSDAVRGVIEWVQFDVNTKPQVFEVTIRVLGGLLSGHILASDERLGHKLDWYRGQLLTLAKDLGERLLPAFNTPTGLPFARINLRHGVMANETTETCVAGAGSLIIEFATLSRLTGDDRFERAAFKAFFALWNRRSDINLVGNNIDVFTGKWGGQETTGIGAGVDSFYEYALKWYVLSGEPEFLDVWNEVYASLMSHSRARDGYSYRVVTMLKGHAASTNVDSLSAFWAGLQVLAGDIQGAIKSHLFYWNLWRKYRAIPELFDTSTNTAIVTAYPLRPEFIESTFFLYQATKDPFYLDVGAQVLRDLQERVKTECGLASIADIVKNKLDDRMESFALSETLKYLYLLFDEENPLASSDSNLIFTTEGHILTLNATHLRPLSKSRRLSRKYENLSCPANNPSIKTPPLSSNIRSRSDYDYARSLVGLEPDGAAATHDSFWSRPYGICEVPHVELFSYEFLLSRLGSQSKEDEELASLKKKLIPWERGVLVNEVMGLRTKVRSRFDGRGYDIVKIGHLEVRQGEKVFFNDSLLFGVPEQPAAKETVAKPTRAASVPIRFYTKSPRLPVAVPDVTEPTEIITSQFVVEASTGDFGLDLDEVRRGTTTLAKFQSALLLSGVPLVRFLDNSLGCSPYSDPSGRIVGAMVYVERGDCTFVEKLAHARRAGALGVIVWHNSEENLRPSASEEDLTAVNKNVREGIILTIPSTAASFVVGRLILQEMKPDQHEVMVNLEKEWPEQYLDEDPSLRTAPTKTNTSPGRNLFINGHAMINTELLF